MHRAWRWLPWFFGAAMLATVVFVALHFSEARQFSQLLQRAEPWWLLVAVALQAATYVAQGETWRAVARAVHWPFDVKTAYQLSLAKLFTDQALPSLGISGSVVMAQALQVRGMPRPAVMSGVIVTTVSYHASYAVSLAAALIVAAAKHETRVIVTVAAGVWVLIEVAISAGALALAGHGARRGALLHRIKPLRGALKFFEDADPTLSRSVPLLLETTAYQIMIFVLDAATIWVLIAALGERAGLGGVFASFVFSTLFRTIGVVPGGLGTFEATSVLTLKMAGVSVPAALSATLLFRGLSFWLPMLPGLWLSRRFTKARRP